MVWCRVNCTYPRTSLCVINFRSLRIHREPFGHNNRPTCSREGLIFIRFNFDCDLFAVPRHVHLAHAGQ